MLDVVASVQRCGLVLECVTALTRMTRTMLPLLGGHLASQATSPVDSS